MEDKAKVSSKRSDYQDVVLDLNFVPQWARKPPDEIQYNSPRHGDDDGYTQRRDRRTKDRSRRSDRPQRERFDRARKPRSDSSDFVQSEAPARSPHREKRQYEPAPAIPVTASLLPEQKRLASLVRQIHHSRRAYPLIDLANLLLRDTDGCLVKLEVDKEARDFLLYQCKHCKQVVSSHEMIVQHLLSKHIEDVYEKQEIEIDPPAGQFVCVARCRKSGVLLGPPNHHSYSDKLHELHQSRFSFMTLDEYKKNIETLHDEELINQWKEECRKKTVYKKKDDPEAEQLELHKVEAEFMRDIPGMYEETRRAIVSSTVAQQTEDRSVKQAVRVMWQKETRFPLSLSFAMRAAFRHMHLYLFKAGKINFVTHVKPRAIRPEDTIENIGEVLMFLQEHPGSTRKHMLEILRPSATVDSPEAAEVLKPLSWLIERGHIIEFFNGTLSVPLGLRKKRR